jgi:hypothetical protein
MMGTYRFNKRSGVITHVKTGRILVWHSPIGDLSGEVIRVRENDTATVVSPRMMHNRSFNTPPTVGIWNWDALVENQDLLDELCFGDFSEYKPRADFALNYINGDGESNWQGYSTLEGVMSSVRELDATGTVIVQYRPGGGS